jgi:hypothetical protein
LFFAGVDAQQDVVGVVVFLIDVVRIVGANHFYVVFAGPAQEHFVHLVLFFHLVALDFDVVVFAENIVPPFKLLARRFLALPQDSLGHHGAYAAGGGDQAFVVLQDEFLVDARVLAVQPFHVAQRAEFDEVFVAFGVFGEEQLVVTPVPVFLRERPAVPVGHHVKLAADNGLYTLVFGGFGHKLEHPEHVAVVGDSQGFHAVGGGFFEQRRYRRCAIKQGVLGMAVEVCELWHVGIWNAANLKQFVKNQECIFTHSHIHFQFCSLQY